MDKIVRNKFWILAVLVLPLVMYGYYSANGALKEATTARETELDGIKSGVSTGNEPNDDYAERLKKINEFLETEIDREILKLWDNQQQRMVWPNSVAQKVPEEFMGEFGFDQLVIYKEQYAGLMQDLQYHIDPVLPTNDPYVDDETRRQKIILAATLPSSEFGSLSITSQEMWDAQMDIWLVDLLFDAFKNINRDKDSVTEAIVRRVDVLQLWGGDGEAALGAGGGGGGDDAYMMEMGGSEGGGGGAAGSTKVTSSVSFSPTQEFGSGGSPKGASGGSGGGGDDGYMMEGPASGSGSGSEPSETLRYIAEDESAPFVERGFYLSVIIMQNKIPDFVVELANSDWPVRVTRFNVGQNPYRQETAAGGGNYMSGGFGNEFSGESSPEMSYEPGGFGSGGSGNFGGNQFGGPGLGGEFGPNGGGNSGKVMAGGMASGLPRHAQAALNHPDLVQLDLCGVITIYRQPTEVIEKLKTAMEADGASPSPGVPSSAAEADSEAMESDPGQAPTPEAVAPETATPSIDDLDSAGEAPVDPSIPGAADPTTETPGPATPAGSPENTPTEPPAAETPATGDDVPFTP